MKAAGGLFKTGQEALLRRWLCWGTMMGRTELCHHLRQSVAGWETGQSPPGEDKVTFRRSSKKTRVTAIGGGLKYWKTFSFR